MCLHRKDAFMEWWQVVDNQDRKNHQHIAINWQAIQYTRGVTLLVAILFCNGKGIVTMA